MQERLVERIERRLSTLESNLHVIKINDLKHIRDDVERVGDRVKMVERLTFVVLASIIAGAVGIIVS